MKIQTLQKYAATRRQHRAQPSPTHLVQFLVRADVFTNQAGEANSQAEAGFRPPREVAVSWFGRLVGRRVARML